MSHHIVDQIRARVAVFQPGGDNERLLIAAADEIERLCDLIDRWADADDALERSAYLAAAEALREAVGR